MIGLQNLGVWQSGTSSRACSLSSTMAGGWRDSAPSTSTAASTLERPTVTKPLPAGWVRQRALRARDPGPDAPWHVQSVQSVQGVLQIANGAVNEAARRCTPRGINAASTSQQQPDTRKG